MAENDLPIEYGLMKDAVALNLEVLDTKIDLALVRTVAKLHEVLRIVAG